MSRYSEIQEKHAIKKQKVQETHDHFADVNDDDYEDDMKLLDLKQRLQLQVKPKFEVDSDQCRSCAKLEACVDIFKQDDEDLDVAYKLKIIGGIEVRLSNKVSYLTCKL